MELDAESRRRRGPQDLISDLPDDLLHNILARLSSTAAAARTSLLSRRWRHVWAYVPEIVFPYNSTASGLAIDSIDAALRACSAPAFRRLEIRLCQDKIDAHRVAQLLRFASQRLVGSLDLSLMIKLLIHPVKQELLLPVFERATEINISAGWSGIIFRLPATGSFMALICLKLCDVGMVGRDLGLLVSLQCPCLRKLWIAAPLLTSCDVSIISESLNSLKYHCGCTEKLEVRTPRLTKMCVSMARQAYIVAPKLEKVSWEEDSYDPSLHQFVGTGRHLRRLCTNLSSALLLRRFDTVDELRLSLSIREVMNRCRAVGCPCHKWSNNLDNITFDSIEEIDISFFNASVKQEEFVMLLLSRCNAEVLKKVDITVQFYRVPSANKAVCRRIRRKCSNFKIEFHLPTKEGLVPFSI